MSEMSCIPIRLYPAAYLRFKTCRLLPGIRLAPFEGCLKELLDETNERSRPLADIHADFHPTHVLCVTEDEYSEGLESRLRKEGTELPECRFVEDLAIVKQVVMALLLTGPIHFEIPVGSYHLKRKDNRWVCSSWGSIALERRVASNTRFPICDVSTREIKGNALRTTMLKLDRYYRSGIWWHDRLGMTLAYFWNGVCAEHPEQAFLSLTTAMESLLTTQSMEITHNLAERVAVLLGPGPDSRLAKYREVKKLYATRSKIVHGKVFPKKGRIDSGTLVVGAKRSNVPRDDMQAIIGMTLSLIQTAFRRPSLLSIIQTRQNENKVDQQLNTYFLKQLFK